MHAVKRARVRALGQQLIYMHVGWGLGCRLAGLSFEVRYS